MCHHQGVYQQQRLVNYVLGQQTFVVDKLPDHCILVP
jgi:hypothetical protein